MRTDLGDTLTISEWIWDNLQTLPATVTLAALQQATGIVLEQGLLTAAFEHHLNKRITELGALLQLAAPPSRKDWTAWAAASLLGCPKLYIGSAAASAPPVAALTSGGTAPQWPPAQHGSWSANAVFSALELSIRSEGRKNGAVEVLLFAIADTAAANGDPEPPYVQGMRDLADRLYPR